MAIWQRTRRFLEPGLGMIRTVIPSMALVICAAAFVVAQSPSMTGTWALEAPAASGVNVGGGEWNLSAQSGTLTLQQSGATITGQWQARMPAPWAVAGELHGDRVELQTEFRDIPVIVDGEKTTRKLRWTFRGVLSGDSVKGQMSLDSESRRGNEQPFTAKRQP